MHEHKGYRFAVFERRGGRWPELATAEERIWMGRFVARIHAVGALREFSARPTLSIEQFGYRSVDFLLDSDWIPDHLVASYESIAADVLDAVERNFAEVGRPRQLRIHGDCHKGNVLWTDQGPHFVDMDDCMNGPAVQDCIQGLKKIIRIFIKISTFFNKPHQCIIRPFQTTIRMSV